MIYIFFLIMLTVIASIFSTIVGFGTGTIMVPILLFFLPLSQVYLLTGVLQLCSSIWKMWLFWPHIKWMLVFNFGLPISIGTIIGAALLFKVPPWIFYRLFGLILIGYTLFLFYNPTFKLKKISYVWLGGIIFGFLGGLFGIRGPLRGAFLTTIDLPKKTYLCTSGAIGIIVDVIRLTIYFIGGMRLEKWLLWKLVLLIPFSFIAATTLGTFIIKKIPQEQFRFLIATILFIVGLRFVFFS